jgi:hypothetical protein
VDAWRRPDLDLHVRCNRPLESLRSVHELSAGDRLDILLSWGGAHRHHRLDEENLLAATARSWRQWVQGFDYAGPEAALIRRAGQRLGHQRRSRQRETERLGQHLAGGGAAHELAGAARGARPALGQLELVPRQLAALERRAHRPQRVGRGVVGGVELGPPGHVHGRQIAAGDRDQLRRDRETSE